VTETVSIERLAAGGDGVGHLADGITVFVPRTAPGDRVILERIERHRRHAFARAARVLEPGPDRAEPRCAHYERDGCGGCQWQHLSPEAQRRAKARVVGDALRRIGKLAVEDPQVVPSPLAFGYRGTVTLAVSGSGERRVVGLRRAGDAGVFGLERCEVAREPLNALWAALRGATTALPEGGEVRVVLRLAADGALHVLVGGGEGAWLGAPALAAAAAAAGLAPTVWWRPEGGAVRRMAGPEADPAVLAFDQVNAEVAAVLRAELLAALPSAPARVLDLYAGTGEVGLELAGRGLDVVTVESDARATRWTEAQAGRLGRRLRVITAKVEEVISSLLPADAVLVNPPRTGLDHAVAEALRAAPPARLVYVSCDPATLSRDLGRLGATGDRLAQARAYEMFPQTSHVETVVQLSDRSAR